MGRCVRNVSIRFWNTVIKRKSDNLPYAGKWMKFSETAASNDEL